MEVKVISPEGDVFAGKADSVILPGESGGFEILNMHAPIVSTLGKGEVVIHAAAGFTDAKMQEGLVSDEKGDVVLEVSSGVVKAQDNHVIILVD